MTVIQPRTRRRPRTVRKTQRMETFTPARAAAWLRDKCPPGSNRSRPSVRVTYLAEQMRAGKWIENGASIVVDTFGRVIDGQHRLAAIVESGTTQELLVAYGRDPSAFKTIDTGTPRSGQDLFTVRGVKNASIVSSVCRSIHAWENCGLVQTKLRVPLWVLDEVFSRYPDRIAEAANAASRISHTAPMAKSSLGITHYLFAQANAAKAIEFFGVLETGIPLRAGDPVHALRERLIRERTARANLRDRKTLSLNIVMVLAAQAWNAHCRGRTLKKIILPNDVQKIPRIYGLGEGQASKGSAAQSGQDAERKGATQ